MVGYIDIVRGRKLSHYMRGMDPRIAPLEYRIAKRDIDLLQERKRYS